VKRISAYTTPSVGGGVTFDVEGMMVDMVTLMKASEWPKEWAASMLSAVWDDVDVQVSIPEKSEQWTGRLGMTTTPEHKRMTLSANIPAAAARAKGAELQQIGARVTKTTYRRLKAHAALAGVTAQTFVELAIDEFLAKHQGRE
jgi:hypothetical protein